MGTTKKVAKTTQTTSQLPEGNFGTYKSSDVDDLIKLVPSDNLFLDGKGSESPFDLDTTTEVVNEDIVNVIKWSDGSGKENYLFLQGVKCINTGLTDTFPFNPNQLEQRQLTKVGMTNFIITKMVGRGDKRKKRSQNVEIK